MKTDELIASLSDKAVSAPSLPAPARLWILAMALFTAYGAIVVMILGGPRADIAGFISHPLIMLEFSLMIALLGTSLWSSICYIYPDQYGQPMITSLPMILLALLLATLVIQVDNVDMSGLMAAMPHHVECLSCIAFATIIPATALFILTQKGATTTPTHSGCCALLASASIGCIALRLTEVTSDMMHLLLSHYAPIMLFAGIGVVLGRAVLKW